MREKETHMQASVYKHSHLTQRPPASLAPGLASCYHHSAPPQLIILEAGDLSLVFATGQLGKGQVETFC